MFRRDDVGYFVLYFFGALTVGSIWVLCRQPGDPPDQPCPRLAENLELREKIATLDQQNYALATRLRCQTLYAELWRIAAERAGTPQSWGGPAVSTIYVLPPLGGVPEVGPGDLIPPPAVPVPVRP